MHYEALASRSWSWWLINGKASAHHLYYLERFNTRSNPDLGGALFIAPRASLVAAKFPSVLK